jgi:hypothetical protein
LQPLNVADQVIPAARASVCYSETKVFEKGEGGRPGADCWMDSAPTLEMPLEARGRGLEWARSGNYIDLIDSYYEV